MKLHQGIVAASLMAAPAVGLGATMVSDVADAFVAGAVTGAHDGDGVAVGTPAGNPGGVTLKVGSVGAGSTDGRAAVYVFQLPSLGALANPFATASLSTGNGATDFSSEVNADLYGLSRRDATATIDFVADYFLGANDTTNATKLQDNFITTSTPENTNAAPVTISTDAAGNLALVAFLNAQYDSGNGAGQFVYLRLNADGDLVESGNPATTGYNVTTGNNSLIKPTIAYDVVPEPAALGVIGLAGLALARRRHS
jgi:hypothetical protein